MRPQRSWIIGVAFAVIFAGAWAVASWWVLDPHAGSTTEALCGEEQPFCNSGDRLSRSGRRVAVWRFGIDPAEAQRTAERRFQAVTAAGVAVAVVGGVLVAHRLERSRP